MKIKEEIEIDGVIDATFMHEEISLEPFNELESSLLEIFGYESLIKEIIVKFIDKNDNEQTIKIILLK